VPVCDAGIAAYRTMNNTQTHQDQPPPGIIGADLVFQNEGALHTGQFVAVVQPYVMTGTVKTGTMMNLPSCRIGISINGLLREVTVVLGKGKSNKPDLGRTYQLPRRLKPASKYVLEVEFTNWQVKQVTVNGVALQEISAKATPAREQPSAARL
jgi:hypothetical protein